MKSKAFFIAGAGMGYVLGTRAGREQFEKIKKWSMSMWQDPRVQAQVNDLEARAAEFAKTEGAALKDKVAETVKSVVGSVRDGAGSSAGAGPRSSASNGVGDPAWTGDGDPL
jgi:histidinol-phosphate/aromatic aminotransferase/cobyric acid decarboxylase-like protein